MKVATMGLQRLLRSLEGFSVLAVFTSDGLRDCWVYHVGVLFNCRAWHIAARLHKESYCIETQHPPPHITPLC